MAMENSDGELGGVRELRRLRACVVKWEGAMQK